MPISIPFGDGPGKGSGEVLDTRRDRRDQCKLIWYQWENEVKDDGSEFAITSPSTSLLSSSRPYDISNHIVNVNFNKSMSTGSGNFSITLSDSLDWKKFMKAGSWMVLMLTGDGDLPLPTEPPPPSPGAGALKKPSVVQSPNAAADISSFYKPNAIKQNPTPLLPNGPSSKEFKQYRSKVRALLYIQRVSIKSSIIDVQTGAKEISYVVSGKDFGICIEETELWFNFFNSQASEFRNLVKAVYPQNGRNLQSMMNLWFDVFLRPESLFNDKLQISKALANLKQWLMPKQMFLDVGIEAEGDSFFGNIKGLKEFHETLFENNMSDPLNGTEGLAWTKLKELSQPEFHELFTELTEEGKPRVFFRPIPWGINQTDYPNMAKTVSLYKDLADNKNTTTGNLGTTVGGLGDLAIASTSLASKDDFRSDHRIDLEAIFVTDYDVGPDFHSRYNQFLIDSNSGSTFQNNAISFFQKENKIGKPFPLRNENSIKRHGFRPMHLTLSSFLTNADNISLGALKANPQRQFLLEANEVLKDYWGQAGEFETGFFLLEGNNDVKLGKVFVTEDSPDFDGVANMVFYIEAYTDHFSVDGKGVGEWIQTAMVTRGIELNDLLQKSGFNEKEPIKKIGIFHEGNK